ncbi:MAG TPA: HAMP domain-containing sensor histidine kinase [Pirellulales bacterium]|jgi:signal transduction histidine kinase
MVSSMRWPIRYQILLPLAGMMLAAVVSVSLLNAWLAASRTGSEVERQLRDVARTLSDAKFPLTARVLEQMHGLAGAEFALTDTSGKVVASSGRQFEGPLPVDRITQRWQDLTLGPPITLGESGFYHIALPAGRRGGNGESTIVHLLYPQGDLRAARRQAVLPPLLVGGVALILCVAVAGFIARQLSLPILDIRARLGRLAEGDFTPEEMPERNDELRDLAVSVNELARQLDELQQAIVRAERLSVLGRLSGGLAHNLRNDVAGALMAVQMHQRHCHMVDQESLDVALRQLSLTEEHLKRFLSAGQPEEPRRRVCDPRELAEELIALLAPRTRHRRIELTLAAAESSATLRADRDQVRQALMNLLLNAIEAVGSGGKVRIQIIDEPNRVWIQVFDSGAGLPAALEPRLGEPLLTTKPEGVGLGLTVARQVAEAHGGELRYRRVGDETCFELSLLRDAEDMLPTPTALAGATTDREIEAAAAKMPG